MTPAPIADRIDAAFAFARKVGRRTLTYAELAGQVFPAALYPRAWRNSTGGGPPGCYMALSAALRRHGFRVETRGPGPGGRVVHPRKRAGA